MSMAPVASSGAATTRGERSSQVSKSSSPTLASKYWISMASCSTSSATTSKGCSPGMRYQSPMMTDCAELCMTHSSLGRSEEHTSELQSRGHLVCRLLLEKKKNKKIT